MTVEGRGEPSTAVPTEELDWMIERLATLRAELLRSEAEFSEALEGVSGERRASARNLIHYVTLRRFDLRVLQERLAEHGFSSLGRAESHVLAKLDAVLSLLMGVAGQEWVREGGAPAGMREGRERLEENTVALLGPLPDERRQRMMVTMPSEAAEDPSLVRRLVAAGMDVMRINCAQDDPATWERMITHLRRAEEALGRRCRVQMDLQGPGVRIGPIEPQTTLARVAPTVDSAGWERRPASLWLTPVEAPEPCPADGDVTLRLRRDFLRRLGPGDRLGFRDARGRRRVLTVIGARGSSRYARLLREAYIGRGTRFHLLGPVNGPRPVTRVRWIPPQKREVRVWVGDTVLLVRPPARGRPGVRDPDGRVREPVRLAYQPGEALDQVEVGDPVWFDDGKAGGVVRDVAEDAVRVEITRARPEGSSLREHKGINLPETELPLPPLTEKDRKDLAFIARHADLVGYSFVRAPADVDAIQDALRELDGKTPGLVLKIETARAFERLPEILLCAMRGPAAGVMVARGDLAVEVGFERLAEVQEEILWLAEAAHMPVIWATEVLRHAAKRNTPRRAELTDAAMAARAEGVMLNKGPYIVEVIRMLTDILRRMDDHQRKKTAMLRPLSVADGFGEEEGDGAGPGT